jgi:hypothetical protein
LISKVIAVGGLGGSGTRILAEIFQLGGIDMGSRLNRALDDLWFTALFKEKDSSLPKDQIASQKRFDLYIKLRQEQRINPLLFRELKKLMKQNGDPRIFSDPPLAYLWNSKKPKEIWGWKEPNTHLYANTLVEKNRGLHYFHLVRDGRYMADSTNQQQFNNWQHLFDLPSNESKQRQRFLFWLEANEAIDRLSQIHPERVHIIRYEDLVLNPLETVKYIFESIEFEIDSETIIDKMQFKPIKPSLNSFALNENDLLRLEKIGYKSD